MFVICLFPQCPSLGKTEFHTVEWYFCCDDVLISLDDVLDVLPLKRKCIKLRHIGVPCIALAYTAVMLVVEMCVVE